MLSGYENHAANSSSDVDFMFHPRDSVASHRCWRRLRTAPVRGSCSPCQHETRACYFVIAKDDGSEIGYLDPDCATDYRTHGRLWLSAEKCWLDGAALQGLLGSGGS